MPQIQSFHTFLLQEETKTKYPRQNQIGHSAAIAALDILKKSDPDLSNYAITMTEIPKVGINPTSHYQTPTGIYFYPASYYYDIIKSVNHLPFQHGAKYINIIKFKENAYVLNLIDKPIYDQFRIKLNALFGTEEVEYLYQRAAAISKLEPKQFWIVTRELSGLHSRKWNRIFAQLGIDVVIDSEGHSIIYDAEPTQGFLIDGTKATVIHRFDNRHPIRSAKKSKPAFTWAYIENLNNLLEKLKRSKEQAKRDKNTAEKPIVVSQREIQMLASVAHIAYSYATDILEGPFPEGEAIIASDPIRSKQYQEFITSLKSK